MWLFLGKDDNVVNEFCHPLRCVSEHLRVFANIHDAFSDVSVFPAFARHDVVDCFFGEPLEGALEESGLAELPFDRVTHRHHEFLCKSLELVEVCLHVLQILAAALDAIVDFCKEAVGDAVDFL